MTMRVLVLCDDLWHPAEVVVQGVRALPAQHIQFDFVMDAKDILTEKRLQLYDVIMNCKCNQITAANTAPWFHEGVTEVGPQQLQEYVRRAAVFYPCIQEMPFMKKMIAKSTSGLWETILSSILRAVRCRWCRRASTPLQKG